MEGKAIAMQKQSEGKAKAKPGQNKGKAKAKRRQNEGNASERLRLAQDSPRQQAWTILVHVGAILRPSWGILSEFEAVL